MPTWTWACATSAFAANNKNTPSSNIQNRPMKIYAPVTAMLIMGTMKVLVDVTVAINLITRWVAPRWPAKRTSDGPVGREGERWRE